MITKQRRNILIGGAVLVGSTAAVGGAFTAGGLTDTSGDAFIGGTASVTITGATLSNVAYAITNGEIDSIAITFSSTADLSGRAVSVELYDNVPAQLAGYTCTNIDVSDQSTCSPDSTKATASAVETVDFTVEN